jgi:hypothetical protein
MTLVRRMRYVAFYRSIRKASFVMRDVILTLPGSRSSALPQSFAG